MNAGNARETLNFVKLSDLPAAIQSRLGSIHLARAWRAQATPDHEPWLAWNVGEDSWFAAAHLRRVGKAVEARKRQKGAILLLDIAQELRRLRKLSRRELASIPSVRFTHFQGFGRKFDPAPGSEWAEGSLPGEVGGGPLRPGQMLRVVPRRLPRGPFAWVSFNAALRTPDSVCQRLGLDWSSARGAIYRVDVSSTLHEACIPTIFDSCESPAKGLWRARPQREKKKGEPWGTTRDLVTGKGGLPEIIVNLSNAGTMQAECVGVPRTDWTNPPFLKGAPG